MFMPSHMTVMLNMTAFINGIILPLAIFILFSSYNQNLTLTQSADFLWHVSCDMSS